MTTKKQRRAPLWDRQCAIAAYERAVAIEQAERRKRWPDFEKARLAPEFLTKEGKVRNV